MQLNTGWMPARSIVESALLTTDNEEQKNAKRAKTSGGGGGDEEEEEEEDDVDSHILILPQYCPWIDHLFELEVEQNIVGKYLYCVFSDDKGGARIRAVPAAAGSFASRKALPTPWRALRDQELSNLINIEGCVFVHNSGFIGGNQTFDGAMAMARAAVRFEE